MTEDERPRASSAEERMDGHPGELVVEQGPDSSPRDFGAEGLDGLDEDPLIRRFQAAGFPRLDAQEAAAISRGEHTGCCVVADPGDDGE